MTETATPQVLTVDEVAERLRIGRSTAYRAVTSGELPSVRIGGLIRVPRAAIDDLLSVQPRA